MRTTIGLAAASAAVLLAGCTSYDNGSPGYASSRSYSRYDYNRPDPSYGGYYADRYYRDDPNRRGYRMSHNDRVYRGQDGRYFCRRSDGTTGLIVGGVAGGVLGNIIAPGGSETLGTILGAAAGAAAGAAIDRGNSDTTCR
jgi:hypothetical protein